MPPPEPGTGPAVSAAQAAPDVATDATAEAAASNKLDSADVPAVLATSETPAVANDAPPAATEAPPAAGEAPSAASEAPPSATEVLPAANEAPPAASEVPSAANEAPPSTCEVLPAASEAQPPTKESSLAATAQDVTSTEPSVLMQPDSIDAGMPATDSAQESQGIAVPVVPEASQSVESVMAREVTSAPAGPVVMDMSADDASEGSSRQGSLSEENLLASPKASEGEATFPAEMTATTPTSPSPVVNLESRETPMEAAVPVTLADENSPARAQTFSMGGDDHEEPEMPCPVAAPSESAADSFAASSPADLMTSVRGRLELLSPEDRKTVTRRECEVSRRAEDNALLQLLKTAEAYETILEADRAVGAPADGEGPILDDALRAQYEERVRLIRGALLALREMPSVSLPKLTAMERARGLACTAMVHTAQTMKQFNEDVQKPEFRRTASATITGAQSATIAGAQSAAVGAQVAAGAVRGKVTGGFAALGGWMRKAAPQASPPAGGGQAVGSQPEDTR